MHYRELIVGQEAMAGAQKIHRLVPLLPREEVYGMWSQLTRAIVSVPANIAEGWTRESPRDKGHFLAVAPGSLAEWETLLTLCERLGWCPEAKTDTVRGLMDETSRMLTQSCGDGCAIPTIALSRKAGAGMEPEPGLADMRRLTGYRLRRGIPRLRCASLGMTGRWGGSG